MVFNLIVWLVAALAVPPPPVLHLAGVRLDHAFQFVGSDGAGLIATIDVTAIAPGMIADNFTFRIFDDNGKNVGEMAPLAMKALDGPDRRWVLLETSVGQLQREYSTMIKANEAILHKGRNVPIDRTGRYEFVYVVGPRQKQGAIVYMVQEPTLPGRFVGGGFIIGPFTVPWK